MLLGQIACDWLKSDQASRQHAVPLMSHIRFGLISEADLIDRVMEMKPIVSNSVLRDAVSMAMDYHRVPHAQPLRQSSSTTPRASTDRLMMIGGSHLNDMRKLHDELVSYDEDMATRHEITRLPDAVVFTQVTCTHRFNAHHLGHRLLSKLSSCNHRDCICDTVFANIRSFLYSSCRHIVVVINYGSYDLHSSNHLPLFTDVAVK